MKILIIEDEQLAAEKLVSYVAKISDEIEVVAILTSVDKTINWLNEHPNPDLILMDIQLEDGICFEIFESSKIETPVIFTTAYDSYAIKAFEVNSVDYLLKPIELEALRRAIEKYRNHFQSPKEGGANLSQLIGMMSKNYKERFFVKIGNHFHSVAVNDIDCFFIRDKGTFLSTNKEKTFAIDYSLDQVHKMVDPARFFRINRNYLINLHAIEDIYSYSTSRLGIKIKQVNHLDLIVSREKVNAFKEWLDR